MDINTEDKNGIKILMMFLLRKCKHLHFTYDKLKNLRNLRNLQYTKNSVNSPNKKAECTTE